MALQLTEITEGMSGKRVRQILNSNMQATVNEAAAVAASEVDQVESKVEELDAEVEEFKASYNKEIGLTITDTYTNDNLSNIMRNASNGEIIEGSSHYDSIVAKVKKDDKIRLYYSGSQYIYPFFTTKKPNIGVVISNDDMSRVNKNGEEFDVQNDGYIFVGIDILSTPDPVVTIVRKYEGLKGKVQSNEENIASLSERTEQAEDRIDSIEDNFKEETNVKTYADENNSDGFVKADGTIVTSFGSWKHDAYNIETIDSGAEYYLYTSFGSGSGVPSCVFFNGSSAIGSTEMSSGERLISIPSGTTKILVNKHPYTVETYIRYVKTTVKSISVPNEINRLDDDIEELKNSIAPEKNENGLKVSISSSAFNVRTRLNDAKDIVISFAKCNNNFMSPLCTYIGDNTATTSAIVGGTKAHTTSDTVAPIQTSNYWFLAGHHGYIVPKIVSSSHDKTSADVGSVWKDSASNQYKISSISGTTIVLMPVVSVGADGVGVRGWNYGTTISGTLTHVSGATSTSAITIDSQTSEQKYPVCFNIVEKFFADGKEIQNGATDKYCDEFVYKVTYDVRNPASMTSINPISETEAWFRISQTYRFVGLSCSVSQSFKINETPMSLVYYGATQPLGLTSYGDYNSFTFIPKVKSYSSSGLITDWKYPQNTTQANQTWATTGFYKNSTYIEDLNNLPERFVQYYANASGGNKLIGFASGLSLISSSTKSNARNENIGSSNRVLHFANDGRNKLYFRVIEESGKVLPKHFTANYNYYQCYFDPSESDAMTYYYKDGNSWVVYVHSFSQNDSAKIVLPSFMEGLTATIVEKTDNASLLSDTVVDGEMFVKFADNTAGYIVLKL